LLLRIHQPRYLEQLLQLSDAEYSLSSAALLARRSVAGQTSLNALFISPTA